MNGQEGVVECAYIQSDVTEAKYFATPLVLGPNGVTKNLGLGTLTPFEQVGLGVIVLLSLKYFLTKMKYFYIFISGPAEGSYPRAERQYQEGREVC